MELAENRPETEFHLAVIEQFLEAIQVVGLLVVVGSEAVGI